MFNGDVMVQACLGQSSTIDIQYHESECVVSPIKDVSLSYYTRVWGQLS